MAKGLPSSKIHPLSEYSRSAFCCQAPPGVGDTPVPRGRLVMEVHRDSVTVQVMRSVEEEPLVGLGEGVGPGGRAELVRYCGMGRACPGEGSFCVKAQR